MRCWLLLLVWVVMAIAAPARAQGSVVAIGGALQEDNDAIWSRVVQLAGGRGARFVVLTQGSSNPDAAAQWYVQQLERHGARAGAVRDASQRAEIERAQGVFFGGGDQVRLRDALAPATGEPLLLQAVRGVLARGGVVAGTSAGAAVLSEWMFTHGDPLAVLQGTAGTVQARGLGLVRPGVLVDQHFIKRGRIARLVPQLVRERIALGLGVEEDSAAVIQGDAVEVIGRRGVLLVDARTARSDERPVFNVSGVRLSWLEPGDQLDLGSGRVIPAPAKRAGRVVGPANADWKPHHGHSPVFSDLLSGSALLDALEHVVDGRTGEVTALSFDARGGSEAPQAVLGFQWRLRRAADTRAWSVGDRYTIDAVLLDVQPVRMARPLYTPWP